MHNCEQLSSEHVAGDRIEVHFPEQISPLGERFQTVKQRNNNTLTKDWMNGSPIAPISMC